MREYRFRGKSTISTEELDEIGFTHDNGWIYGTYIDGYIINGVEEASTDYIAIGNWCPVIPETVGQDTGLKDKNGVGIYQDDIIKCENYHGEVEGTINYHHSYYYLACSSGYSDEYLMNCSDIKVIGNTTDNPELLEVQK